MIVQSTKRSRTIVVVSSKWPGAERSGVSLLSATHSQMLREFGYSVVTIGSGPQRGGGGREAEYPNRFVYAKGSGAVYSPACADLAALRAVLQEVQPSCIIVEGWQSAICEATIRIAKELGLRVALISHGVSVTRFSDSFWDRVRALGWIFYRWRTLPKLVRKLDGITTLSSISASPRFSDRSIAVEAGLPVFLLTNSPVNVSSMFWDFSERRSYIVCVGYFSRVKNQLLLIRLMRFLPAEISLRLVGRKAGEYFERCRALVVEMGMSDRIFFLDDTECDIAEEISRARLCVSVSITEALPVVLLESMWAGTPFVATDVGAVASLSAGGRVCSESGVCDAILEILGNEMVWRELSLAGRVHVRQNHSEDVVRQQLRMLVSFLVGESDFSNPS